MDQEAVLYLGVTVVVVFLVMALSGASGPLGILIVILGLATILLLMVIYFADFLVFPFFTKLAGITIIPAKNYTIPKTQEAILKYTDGIYYATGYLTGNVYSYVFKQEEQNAAEEEQLAIAAGPDKWERAIMNATFPFKFNVVTVAQDIQKYRDELEGQRGLLQFQYSKEAGGTTANPMSLLELERQMRVIQAKIDRLGEGERPVNAIIYMESTAVGVSEKDAMDALTTQLNQLMTIFNSFDLSITRVYGREMYLLFNLNYSIPSLDELKSMFSSQK